MSQKLYTRKKKIKGGSAIINMDAVTDMSNKGNNIVSGMALESKAFKNNAANLKGELDAKKVAAMNQVNGVQNAAMNQVNGFQNAAMNQVNGVQNAAMNQVNGVQNAAMNQVNGFQNAAMNQVNGVQNAAMNQVNGFQNAAMNQETIIQNKEIQDIKKINEVIAINENTVAIEKAKEDAIEKENEAEKESEDAIAEREAREAEKEALIASLKQQIEVIEKKLEELKPDIIRIYDKSKRLEENKNNLIKEELSQEEFEIFKNYINIYKELIEKNDELYTAENASTKDWSISAILLSPIKKFFSSLLGNIKKMSAKATMASVTGMTGFVVQCYEEIQPQLIKFAQLQGETQRAIIEATRIPPAPGLPSTPGLPTTPGLPSTSGLPSTPGLPTTPGLPSTSELIKGGSKKINPIIKEVQKGGASAAKRAENSIKQFLSSSVTSSHVLNMVKRKTKVKRKRDGKMYSRKRAKK